MMKLCEQMPNGLVITCFNADTLILIFWTRKIKYHLFVIYENHTIVSQERMLW